MPTQSESQQNCCALCIRMSLPFCCYSVSRGICGVFDSSIAEVEHAEETVQNHLVLGAEYPLV
jgi:hypothetical protein